MDKQLKFSKDVYHMSFEDFEAFVKSKFSKIGKKKLRELYEKGYSGKSI